MTGIFYIPGVGTEKMNAPQRRLVQHWDKPERPALYFPSRWDSDEPYDQKYARLQSEFSDFLTKVQQVQIIAVSAGGSLASRLATEHSNNIESLHLISSKLKGADIIGEAYRKPYPALYDAVKASESVLPRLSKSVIPMTVYRPWVDRIVPLEDMLVQGAVKRRVPAFGHVGGIVTTLLFYVP